MMHLPAIRLHGLILPERFIPILYEFQIGKPRTRTIAGAARQGKRLSRQDLICPAWLAYSAPPLRRRGEVVKGGEGAGWSSLGNSLGCGKDVSGKDRPQEFFKQAAFPVA
jgi:hypothetical protein